MDHLSTWANKWGMKFNVSKCAHMQFGSSFPNTNFTRSVITTTTNYKYLGVVITSLLSFTSNLNKILSKAYRSSGLIRRAVPPARMLT